MKKIPNFIPLQTALIDDIRIKRLNKDHLNCSGLGILIGLYFYLLKNPNLTCSYNEIDIIADELKASIPIIVTVIERYNLFEIIKDTDGNKFFSPILNNSLEPYFEICETNKIRSDLATLKRKQKKQQQLKELKNLLSVESSRLNLPNIIEYNIIKSNVIEKKISSSSSSNNFSYENEKEFEEFFNWLKGNIVEPIKNERYYKNTIHKNLINGDIKTLENWGNFLAYKKEDRKKAFIRRIQNLECKQIFYLDCYRYILKIEINENSKEFKITTSYFDDKEINHIITCKFSQLEEIEKLIKKESSS
ncbi:hypothetical protein [Aliarcobacter cibarius]|uniref:DUF4373 domain-containing protein n=1 Tax=Aliarcobacter cibarius TaxID=255507 RepID=A0ABY2V3B8_9BACT|nr:hypothetical protein [Aliarcobacter cibarius]TLS98059.1 hypothetical protein FE247_07625 [Aliarcobacter cibarius]TLS98979.1 hypothetical protein FE245_07255 [Aliarcobacter cibarius]